MSQTGQQHPKADVGGQRPHDPKPAHDKSSTQKGAAQAAIDAGKAADAGGKKDAKK